MGLYRQVVPVGIKYLRNLSKLLEKGAKFAEENSMKHEELLEYRLVSDMRGLTYQVQSCCNTLKFIPARVGVSEDVVFADNETTFSQLQNRIADTISLLEKVDAMAFDAKEYEEVLMKTRMGDFKFQTAQDYVSDYALPNFHFHLTSAYCILRHLGVQIGAMDYLGKETFVKA